MENLKLTITEDATLDSLLYYASKSEEISNSRKKSRLIFAGIMSLLSVLFLMFNPLVSLLFLVIGGLITIFFSQYLKWYYKRHLKKTIQN